MRSDGFWSCGCLWQAGCCLLSSTSIRCNRSTGRQGNQRVDCCCRGAASLPKLLLLWASGDARAFRLRVTLLASWRLRYGLITCRLLGMCRRRRRRLLRVLGSSGCSGKPCSKLLRGCATGSQRCLL